MKKIIIVAGYCATGKSTFARKLSEKFMIPLYSKDTLKENLADSIGPMNKNVIDELSATTFNLMHFISENNMKVNQAFILESNFRPKEAEKLNSLIVKYSYEILTLLFKGNLEILKNRYATRDEDGLRHWVHKTFKGDYDEFVNANLPLGEINLNNIVIIDATSFENINYSDLYNTVNAFLNNRVGVHSLIE